jgi:hypothetical protein
MSFFARQTVARPITRRSHRHRGQMFAKLRLEEFEDRCIPATFHVTVNTDTPGQLVNGELRKAILDARAHYQNAQAQNPPQNPVEVIDFKNPNNNNAELNGAIQLAAALPALNFRFLITGPGSNKLTIQVAPMAAFRVFTIEGKAGTIQGLALNGGDVSNQANQPDFRGGTIYSTGDLTLKDVAISGSAALTGGGIESRGNLTLEEGTSITNCTAVASANVAGSGEGGGIHMVQGGTLKITLSRFDTNKTESGRGGGVYTDRPTTIDRSTFVYNEAFDGGRALPHSSDEHNHEFDLLQKQGHTTLGGRDSSCQRNADCHQLDDR